MEPKTAQELYAESTEQRQTKVDNFVEKAQDGNKLLVQHTIHIELVELIDNPELKFPASRAIEVENNEKIKSAVTDLTDGFFAQLNEINYNENLSSVSIHSNVEALKPYRMPKNEECSVEIENQEGFTPEGEFVTPSVEAEASNPTSANQSNTDNSEQTEDETSSIENETIAETSREMQPETIEEPQPEEILEPIAEEGSDVSVAKAEDGEAVSFQNAGPR